MSLKEQLMDDLKTAMRDKDVVRKNAVQMVRAAVLQTEKDQKIVLDDEGVLEIVAREVKKRKDVLPEYQKSGREDLIQDLEKEIQVLMAYLPEQLTEDEIRQIVEETVKEVGAASMKDMGKVMQALMPKTKGRADGKTVNSLVKQILA